VSFSLELRVCLKERLRRGNVFLLIMSWKYVRGHLFWSLNNSKTIFRNIQQNFHADSALLFQVSQEEILTSQTKQNKMSLNQLLMETFPFILSRILLLYNLQLQTKSNLSSKWLTWEYFEESSLFILILDIPFSFWYF
jgi:hypothetical protein